MKLLVVGCSFSSGWGFIQGKDDAGIWPNLLEAEVTNLSVTGTDNTGIFLNTLLANPAKFDHVIVQWTGLDRVVIGNGMINHDNPLAENILPNQVYTEFYKAFLILNKRLTHWTRFCQMIEYLQQYQNVHFLNGLVDWDKTVFDSTREWDQIYSNRFLHSIINTDLMTDAQIQTAWAMVKSQISAIDLTRWVNPFNSLQSTRVDQVSTIDLHPGPVSQQKYAELIRNRLRR